MKVKALANGFYKGHRIRAGQVFNFSGSKPGKWMQPLADDAKPEVHEVQPETPVALSELAKSQPHKAHKHEGRR